MKPINGGSYTRQKDGALRQTGGPGDKPTKAARPNTEPNTGTDNKAAPRTTEGDTA